MSIHVEIHKSFGDFSLDAAFSSERKRIGILGASGCGKSMTLKSIAGIVKPDSGEIILDGRTLFSSAERRNEPPKKRRIGYLFQNYALFPNMSVLGNVEAGIRHLPREERTERAMQMLRKFSLEGLERRFPDELSGGQQQRAALARIMACSPDAVLLDEPFSALDIFLRHQVMEETARLFEDYQGTVILVSHSSEEIYRFAEDLVVLDQGRAVTAGRTADVFRNPRAKAAAVLTGCRNFSDAVRLSDHEFAAPSWGLTVRTERVLPEDFNCIGYREEDWIPVSAENAENDGRGGCAEGAGAAEGAKGAGAAGRAASRISRDHPQDALFLRQTGALETPSGESFFLRVPDGADSPVWSVNRAEAEQLEKNGMPLLLRMDERKILFLRDSPREGGGA